jgi:hypothetical protein
VNTVLRKCDKGMWYVHEDNDQFYLYWQAIGQLPQLMLVCKSQLVFDTLAECLTGLYGVHHPEIMRDDRLSKEISEIIE